MLTSSFSSASRTHLWSSLVAASAAIVCGAACCRCVSAWHKNPCTRRTISPTVEGVTCSSSSASTKRCTPASETGASACKSVTRCRVSILTRAEYRARSRASEPRRAQLCSGGAPTEQCYASATCEFLAVSLYPLFCSVCPILPNLSERRGRCRTSCSIGLSSTTMAVTLSSALRLSATSTSFSLAMLASP